MIYDTAENNNEFREFSCKFLRLQAQIATHRDGDLIKLILLSYIVACGKIAFFDCENSSRTSRRTRRMYSEILEPTIQA